MESLTTSPSTDGPRALEFGRFRFDQRDRLLFRDGQPLALPPRALLVLGVLLAEPGRLITKERLLDAVWGERYVSEGVLKEVIFLLRQTLGDQARRPIYIQTVHRRGYRFVAKLEGRGGEHANEESEPTTGLPPTAPLSCRGRWTLPALAIGLGAAAMWLRTDSPPRLEDAVPRLAIEGDAEPPVWSSGLALDVDGQLVFVGKTDRRRLYLRTGDRAATAIAGTEGARHPSLSPDGQRVAFFAGRNLKLASLSGGASRTLAAAPEPLGVTWLDEGTVVFAADGSSGLQRVSIGERHRRSITTPTTSDGEISHRWPVAVPGRGMVLFTGWRGEIRSSRIAVLELDTGRSSTLLEGGSSASFAPPRHLLYALPGELWSRELDLDSLELVGPAIHVARIDTDSHDGEAQFAVSRRGALAYLAAEIERGDRILTWLEPEGRRLAAAPPPGRYSHVSTSRDGLKAVLTVSEGAGSDLWIADLASGRTRRLTRDGKSGFAVWSARGEVIYARIESGAGDRTLRSRLLAHTADGSAAPRELAAADTLIVPRSVSDGGVLAFSRLEPTSAGASVWLVDIGRDEAARRVMVASEAARDPMLSPSGRTLAWVSGKAGRPGVFVRAVEGGPAVRVSGRGAGLPRWSRDGGELFFVRDGRLMVAVVSEASPPRVGSPRVVATVGNVLAHDEGAAPRRWLLLAPVGDDLAAARRIRLIADWRTHRSLTSS